MAAGGTIEVRVIGGEEAREIVEALTQAAVRLERAAVRAREALAELREETTRVTLEEA